MAAAMLVALGLDALFGWPKVLYARIGHPVTWIGAVIAWADRSFNKPERSAARRRFAGFLTALGVIIGTAIVAALAQGSLSEGVVGVLLTGVLAWPLVAAKSLHDHVRDVADPLVAGDTDGARRAVSMIVGRNPETLDNPAIARAALESLAENASDGVVAPLFWGAIFGLPGIAGYKAINTLDSMIGYRTARHEAFGWAAARIDDVANFLPARLTGGLIAMGSQARNTAFRTMRRDAGAHRSPNAGWPEAAMAGALGVRLSGPRVYDGTPSDDPWLNGVADDPRGEDVLAGLRVFRRAILWTAGLLFVAAVV